MVVYKFKDAVKKGVEKGGYEQGTNVAVLAYHAKTEKGTAEIAEDVHGKSPSSMYVFNGPRVTSTRVTHTHSDKLNKIIKNAKTGVSVHGHEGENIIYVSGQNSQLSKKIAKELKDGLGTNYKVETNPDYIPRNLKGTSNYNIVNKFEQGGVQIELPRGLRKNEKHRKVVGDSISNAVSKYGEGKVLQYKGKDYKEEMDKAA